MADQLEVFKKEFAKIRQEIDTATLEIAGVNDSMFKLNSVRVDAQNALFRHGSALSDKGASIAKLEDLLKDKTAGGLHDEIMKSIKSLDTQSKKGKMAFTRGRQFLSKLETLEKGIADEIKSRKGKVSTKLGVGNKSLPAMEKLLKDVTKYREDDDDRETIREYDQQDGKFYEADVKKSLADTIKKLSAGTKPDKEFVDQWRLFEPRLIGGAANKTKILYDAMTGAGADDAAEAKKKAGELMKLTEPYAKLKVGPETRAKLERDSDGKKIAKLYDAIIKMRGAAEKLA